MNNALTVRPDQLPATLPPAMQKLATEISPEAFDVLIEHLANLYMAAKGVHLPPPNDPNRAAYYEFVIGQVGSLALLSAQAWAGQYFGRVLREGFYMVKDITGYTTDMTPVEAMNIWCDSIRLNVSLNSQRMWRLSNLATVAEALAKAGYDVTDDVWALVTLDDKDHSVSIPVLTDRAADLVRYERRLAGANAKPQPNQGAGSGRGTMAAWRDPDIPIRPEAARLIAEALASEKPQADFVKEVKTALNVDLGVRFKPDSEEKTVLVQPMPLITRLDSVIPGTNVPRTEVHIVHADSIVLRLLANSLTGDVEISVAGLSPHEAEDLVKKLEGVVEERFAL